MIEKKGILLSIPANFLESMFFYEIIYEEKKTEDVRSILISMYITGIYFYSAKGKIKITKSLNRKLFNIFNSCFPTKRVNDESAKLRDYNEESKRSQKLIDKEIDEQENTFYHQLKIKRKIRTRRSVNNNKIIIDYIEENKECLTCRSAKKRNSIFFPFSSFHHIKKVKEIDFFSSLSLFT